MISQPPTDRRSRAAAETAVAVKPSVALRPMFLALSQQVGRWMASHGTAPVLLGVTSLNERAGKSTVAFNLAAALSGCRAGRVLLIEAGSSPSYALAGRRPRNGFAQVMLGTVAVDQAVLREALPAVDILAGQRLAPNELSTLPWELLPRIANEQMIDYSCVVFDLPTASAAEFPCLAASLGGVLLVVEARDIDAPAVEAFRASLRRSGTELVGLVVNKADRHDSAVGS